MPAFNPDDGPMCTRNSTGLPWFTEQVELIVAGKAQLLDVLGGTDATKKLASEIADVCSAVLSNPFAGSRERVDGRKPKAWCAVEALQRVCETVLRSQPTPALPARTVTPPGVTGGLGVRRKPHSFWCERRSLGHQYMLTCLPG